MSCKLGECGMTATCEDLKGNGKKEHLVFSINLETRAESIPGLDIDVFMQPALTSSIQFNCAYPTAVSVSSDDFGVVHDEFNGKILQEGSLFDGFGIEVFTDKETIVPVGPTNVLIGQSLYAAVSWQIQFGVENDISILLKILKFIWYNFIRFNFHHIISYDTTLYHSISYHTRLSEP